MAGNVLTAVVAVDPEDALLAVIERALKADKGIDFARSAWPPAETTSPPDAVVVVANVGKDVEHVLGAAPADMWATARLVAVVDAAGTQRWREIVNRGADAVVLGEDAVRALALTVRAACAGQLVVPRELGRSLYRPQLTTREKQVMGMVVMGFSNREIADKLVLEESTVKSHLFSAFRRLGVRSRKEASALILDPEKGYGSGILTISDQ